MGAADAGGGDEATAFEAGGGVVLDDEVLEVGDPDGAVGADFGVDGGVPFIGAGVEVHVVEGFVAGAVGLDVHEGDDFHGGLADHGFALEAFGEGAAVDEVGASGGGVAAEDVDLAEVGGDGVAGVDDVDFFGGLALGAFGVSGGGDAAEEDGGAVGGAAELVAGVVGAVGPGVVGEPVEELELGAVRFEAIGAHGELLFFAADDAFDAGVADAAVDPVVEAVVQVAGLGVGVADAPAVDDGFAEVGFVVAVGVFEVDEFGGGGDDDAFAGEDDAGGEVQFVGEDGEFVGLAVAVGVFADFDAVLAFTGVGDAVGVVAGFDDPAAAAVVPGEGDGFGDAGFGGEEFQFAVGRDLGALHAAFDGERELEGEGFGALFVVGDLGVGFAFFGVALGEEGVVGGEAIGGEFGEDVGFEV